MFGSTGNSKEDQLMRAARSLSQALKNLRILPSCTLAALIFLLAPEASLARVERLEITAIESFADGRSFGKTGPYEKIRGRLHYAIDPQARANQDVVDLEFAPRDSDGLVRFSGEFMILRPRLPDRGNGTILYEVGNRGGVGMISFMNDATHTNNPSHSADAGNGFLFDRGYTLVWSAWNWDVLPGDNRMSIRLPVAREAGRTITGRVSVEITVDRLSFGEPLAWGRSLGYQPADLTPSNHILTVRNDQYGPRLPIDSSRWQFAKSDGENFSRYGLLLEDGFTPGRLYELVYEARDPVVVGLGLTAIRDALSFFRFGQTDDLGTVNPLADTTENAVIFGISQSGRVIKHMLYQGFHVDALNRMVFDGALIHVAGGGKGSFNHRFAQTTRHPSVHQDHQYPADFFPFTTLPATDPKSGQTSDILAQARAKSAIPKMMFVNTSGEYWTRSASLIHTSPDGTQDIGFHDNARGYMIAGAQHGNWISPRRGRFEACGNPLNHSPVLRALLVRLTEWVTNNEAPPESRVPSIKAGELATVKHWQANFPEISRLRLPQRNLAPPRLDLGPRWESQGIIDVVPPRFGEAYQTLVPMPDQDGIDLGGIRLPAVQEPAGTYLGWNLRNDTVGASHMIGRWTGTFVPFARTSSEKPANDQRLPLDRRFGDEMNYRAKATQTAEKLVEDGLLLASDVPLTVDRAVSRFLKVKAHSPNDESCTYLVP